ncbi:MAG: M1 family peptidase [Taibaiella sp.]|nr:M1 family peptidase [Taibaiella sp.]
MRYRLLLLLFIIAQHSFATVKRHAKFSRDTIQHIVLDTLEVSAPAGATPYQPSAPKSWEIINTRVALTFNPGEKSAVAREWILLHPYCYPVDSVILDAKGMLIDSVIMAGNNDNHNLNFTYTDSKLKIKFNRSYLPSDTLKLNFKYTALPYSAATSGSMAISDDRGLYFINPDNKIPHKPVQIWTQGETESNSHWMITIDKPNTRFTTQIELTVPDSLTTLSNGALVKQVKGRNRMRTDIWKMDKTVQAYAVMFAVGKFIVVKDKWKDKEVSYYVEPAYAPDARLMFKNTCEMMDYFSKRTGVPYPWNKYSQVVVRDYVSGAMENTSASLFGEFMNQNAREIADKDYENVVSHELFHQWFGDYVTCESWSNVTVNESFANYGEQLWREHKYGKAESDELAWNDLQAYIYSSQIKDPHLVRFNYDSREEVFDAISYNKGGAILHYLNSLIGDTAFDKAMKLYLTENALSSAEAHNWRMAVEKVTGQDWNWFFNQWYFHPGHPVLKINYNYIDTLQKLIVTVSQVQNDSPFLYSLPLKTALLTKEGIKYIDWNIKKKNETFVYDYVNGRPPVVVPDYRHLLPGELKQNKKLWQWLIEYRSGNDYVSKKLALTAAYSSISDSAAQEIINLSLNDDISAIVRFSLSKMQNIASEKYHTKWRSAINSLAAGSKNNGIKAEAIAVLGAWKIEEQLPLFYEALKDSSYSVAGNALDAISKINTDTAYVFASSIIHTDPRASLKNTAWAVICKKGMDDDIALIGKYYPYEQGNRKFYSAINLSSYLKKVKSDDSYAKGVGIYASLVLNEEMKLYRNTLAGYFFQLADVINGNLKSEDRDEAATAQRRWPIIREALNKIVSLEEDSQTKEKFTKMLAGVVEEK